MNPRLPAVTPREVVRVLERDGWVLHRHSHAHYKKEGHQFFVTVAMHRRDVRPGTLRGIIDDAEISEERFLELLRS